MRCQTLHQRLVVIAGVPPLAVESDGGVEVLGDRLGGDAAVVGLLEAELLGELAEVDDREADLDGARGDAVELPVLPGGQVRRAGHLRDQRVIKRLDEAQVGHSGGKPLGIKLVGGFQRFGEARAQAQDRDFAPLVTLVAATHDPPLADRQVLRRRGQRQPRRHCSSCCNCR